MTQNFNFGVKNYFNLISEIVILHTFYSKKIAYKVNHNSGKQQMILYSDHEK